MVYQTPNEGAVNYSSPHVKRKQGAVRRLMELLQWQWARLEKVLIGTSWITRFHFSRRLLRNNALHLGFLLVWRPPIKMAYLSQFLYVGCKPTSIADVFIADVFTVRYATDIRQHLQLHYLKVLFIVFDNQPALRIIDSQGKQYWCTFWISLMRRSERMPLYASYAST